MKKAKQSNPLKTFNDNYDNRVKSFDKTLKKFQGNIKGSQVSAFDLAKDKMKDQYRSDLKNSITNKAQTDSLNKLFPRTISKPSGDYEINTGSFKTEPKVMTPTYKEGEAPYRYKKGGQTKSKKK